MKNLPTLRNDSSFADQFSISVSKTRAILLFKIKIKLIEMLELLERMAGMRSAEDWNDIIPPSGKTDTWSVSFCRQTAE